MSSSLQITTELINEGYVITAVILPNGTLPLDIFVYNNTGTTELGDFYGVAQLSDLHRLQVWAGVPIQVFGNAYVRHSQAKINVSITEDIDLVKSRLIARVKELSLAYQAAQTSTTITLIP